MEDNVWVVLLGWEPYGEEIFEVHRTEAEATKRTDELAKKRVGDYVLYQKWEVGRTYEAE